MARSLEQILAEINPSYAGSEQLIQQQQAALAPAADAEIAGLDAKLTQANDNILSSARGRGLGFSGIPVAEQAKYAASEYAPAVARVRSDTINRSTALTEQRNQLGRDKMSFAQSLLQQELNRDEQARQFNEQLQLQREQMAAQERAARAAASAGGGAYLGGGISVSQAQQGQPSQAEQAYLNVKGFLSKGRAAAESDYAATLKSANKGNAFDKLKIEAYHRAGIRPGNNNGLILSGLGGLSFNTSSNGLSGNILKGVSF